MYNGTLERAYHRVHIDARNLALLARLLPTDATHLTNAPLCCPLFDFEYGTTQTQAI
jgi:hypothetical protein